MIGPRIVPNFVILPFHMCTHFVGSMSVVLHHLKVPFLKLVASLNDRYANEPTPLPTNCQEGHIGHPPTRENKDVYVDFTAI